jgi:AcrR family transcriptional regulator
MVTTFHDLDLKEACIQAAREVIAEQGVEGLSLRDVARRLGVSHQAPYKHYASRDHLLAEVIRRCFVHFAEALDARQRHDDARAELHELGRRYLVYATQHALEYRLMFATPWPEPAQHPELVRTALHAFDVLRAVSERDAYANLVLPSLLSDRGITGRDAAFATELAYGTCRTRGTLDAVIAAAAGRPIDQIDSVLLDLLRLGAYQLRLGKKL